MIIQSVLIVGLLFCLLYAFLQRARSPLVSLAIGTVSIVGIYFVAFPEQTARLAHLVGVGRGADLVLYCWLVISLAITINLQFKILSLQGMITVLARELALLSARDAAVDPDDAPDQTAHST
jgi:small membrane protein